MTLVKNLSSLNKKKINMLKYLKPIYPLAIPQPKLNGSR